MQEVQIYMYMYTHTHTSTIKRTNSAIHVALTVESSHIVYLCNAGTVHSSHITLNECVLSVSRVWKVWTDNYLKKQLIKCK
jgi:hypothetical protein